MEEPKNKYILLHDRIGYTLEENRLPLGLSTKSTPARPLPRGELLEVLPEVEQPLDSSKIALVVIGDNSWHLECRTDETSPLSDEDANLLLAISSSQVRYGTFIERKRLDFGRRLYTGDRVSVSVKGISVDVTGVVRYIGQLPSNPGTMFGVELTRNPGIGWTDGRYRHKRYFTCAPDSGVFVGVDKLKPILGEESPPESPKRDKADQANLRRRLKSFLRRKHEQKLPQVRKIGERVVTFIGDFPAKGTVHYIGEEKDSSGKLRGIVGLEMDERVGQGIGTQSGPHLFLDLETVIPETDFDENPAEAAAGLKKILDKKIGEEELGLGGSADDASAAGGSSQTETSALTSQQNGILAKECEDNSDFYSVMQDEERKVHRGNDPKENLQRYVRELEQKLTNVQLRFRDKKLQVANLNKQLKEREQQEENSRRQLREMAQQLDSLEEERGQHLTNFQDQLREREDNSQRQLREVEEQLREKDEQKENLQRQLGELEQQLENSERLSREREQQLTHFQRQLQVKELQEASLHEQLGEKEQQEENLQRQMREVEQQLRNQEVQFREKEQESANLQQQVATQEERLRANQQRVNELEVTLSTAQQAFSEQQRRQCPDWVIPRDQIQQTDKVLGRGGWGSVVEGKYCGCAVAVKQIHELILSPHNRNLFEREMDIASRCRHPCLLQFIGATNDEGSPLFVTELMESSLRALLEQRSLSAAEVSIISLDVARAINYLHHKTPPIIHRDISSANVLLWRHGNQWRGKVSDYGTANFMQQTMTVCPGAMIYMAPEALTSKQTVKVDVYSFGVLLCEMCIRELPDPERRDQQIAMVTNHVLRTVIRGCVQADHEARPNMEEIIEEFEEQV